MDFYDLTAPGAPLTGEEKSICDLAFPDERIQSYLNYSIEKLQANLIRFERSLGTKVPEEIKKRLNIAKNLAIYGWFQWEFFTVSLFWSLTTIEMALKQKLIERFDGTFNLKRKKEQKTLTGSFEQLEQYFRNGWKIIGLPKFNGSFHALLVWARDENVLPKDTPVVMQELSHSFNNWFKLKKFPKQAQDDNLLKTANPTDKDIEALWQNLSDSQRAKYQAKPLDVLVKEIPELRNKLAHPTSFSIVLMVRSAVEGYAQAVEIINRLFTYA